MKCLGHALLTICAGGVLVWADDGDRHRGVTSQPSPAAADAPTVGQNTRPRVLDPGSAGPEALTRANWDAVLSVLRDPTLDLAAREAEIQKIATPIIDFPLMAKLALGRTHWRRFTPAQRTRYLDLFVERLKIAYRGRIAKYEGWEARFGPGLSDASRPPHGTPTQRTPTQKPLPKGIAHVPIQLVSRGRTVAVLHKFRKSGRRWRIYDIEIEGVSTLLTYRSQFNDILRRGGPEDLLRRLEQSPPH